jgi:hypothetical protein
VCRDGWIDKGFPDRLELGQRAFFIRTHQAAVTGDVCRQYCHKPPFHMLAGQRLPLSG